MYDLDELRIALKDVEVIATDVDDTLTIQGILTSGVIKAIEYLNTAGKKVILVTGRSGGACTTLSQYLPVEMVIAENGGVVIRDHDITTIDLPADHTVKLHACFDTIRKMIPDVKQAQDNPFRLTDLSMDNRSIQGSNFNIIKSIAESFGFTVAVSSVQTHILLPTCSKAVTLKSILNDRKTVTIGDSANDESMFDPKQFPLSVGVANIIQHLGMMKYRPRWIMSKEQGYGFIEFVDVLKSAIYLNT
jgi:hydroxymethylpyrimidine pyrophosphatase-like HAD family hydrolase